ncbi:MAG TPA: pyridoxal-phosphate dependent enzyme [Bacteroidia bacterium]|jgi:1-aminocyclopropane-1-carboxylate deaminase/D-cysteine desulfhydrase-like pyridoxal-dependent ACC family enzyme|nr:pyridoxal-phosphate dependent enzyme [Bacteroidia bacterium]
MQIELPGIPLQPISDAITTAKGIQLYMLRTDMNHPHISGNKLYKLKYNLEAANRANKNVLLTFGGAYSNHIAAVAAAGKTYGFKTIGIIRGEQCEILNPTLEFACSQGMHLEYVSRDLYRQKEMLLQQIKKKYGDEVFIIPEGGSNELGVLGCKEIVRHIPIHFDHICCACGTGTTLSGIILSLKDVQKALGIQVLKAPEYIQQEVKRQLQNAGQNKTNWCVWDNYHFDGYAKIKTELITFIEQFENSQRIPLDPVYTGKMMYGLYDLIQQDYFKKGETIVAVHTGGLQGRNRMRGF